MPNLPAPNHRPPPQSPRRTPIQGHAALNDLPVALLLTRATPGRPDGLVHANVAFERLTGHGLAGATGCSVLMLLGLDSERLSAARVTEALLGQQPLELETPVHGADGRSQWMQLRLNPLSNSDGDRDGDRGRDGDPGHAWVLQPVDTQRAAFLALTQAQTELREMTALLRVLPFRARMPGPSGSPEILSLGTDSSTAADWLDTLGMDKADGAGTGAGAGEAKVWAMALERALWPEGARPAPGAEGACESACESASESAGDAAAPSLLQAWAEAAAGQRPLHWLGRTANGTAVRVLARSAAPGDVHLPWHAVLCDASVEFERERRLQDTQDLLGRLASQHEAERDQERRGLALHLHDDLGQLLNAARLEIGQVHRRLARGELDAGGLDRLDELLGRSTASARAVVRRLRPPVLDLGLVPALESLCNQFSREGDTRCSMRAPEDLNLSPSLVDAFYRITDEALRNCARHASARLVQLWLRQDGDELCLDIDDDGCGFDTSLPGPGLQRMRERLLLLAGHFSVDSRPGHGTRLRMRAPLPVTARSASARVVASTAAHPAAHPAARPAALPAAPSPPRSS